MPNKDVFPRRSSRKFRIALLWAHRQLGSIEHEHRVSRTAAAVFRLTGARHQLDRHDLLVLQLGAALHDLAKRIDEPRHPTLGAKMILKDKRLPLSDEERRRVAYLTRYHRGAVPEVGYDDILVPGDCRKKTRLLLAILRAADTLDNRQHHPPRLMMSLKGNRLQILCHLDDHPPRARRAFTRRKKFRLLEELLDCKVEVKCVETSRAAA